MPVARKVWQQISSGKPAGLARRLIIRRASLRSIGRSVNTYLSLGVRPRGVNFRTVWHQNENPRCALKDTFQNRQNWPLRGLYWLSRDLLAEGDDRDALDPDAQDLVLMRNHIEHKHLTVHAESWVATNRGHAGESPDGFSFGIDRHDFEARALRMLKLVRSALIYLIHAVLTEEQIRTAARPDTQIVIPLVLDPIDDAWKQ